MDRKRRAPSLSRVTAYRNPRIVHGFLRQYRVSEREAERLFVEMLKWLWLVNKVQGALPVFTEMQALDEMWHVFVLHTADYQQFCTRYFGALIHHDPDTGQHPRRKKRPSARERARLDKELEDLIATVYDELGQETAVLWFATFVRRYTPAFMEARRTKPAP